MIHAITGDATDPVGGGIKFIAHCCNDIGAWGAGFVLALNQNLGPKPALYYKQWRALGDMARGTAKPFALGHVQYVAVDQTLIMCNIIAQHDIHRSRYLRRPPIRYSALRQGLEEVCDKMQVVSEVMNQPVSLHCPRLGCGLAGGDWPRVYEILDEVFEPTRTPVYVYQLP